MELMGAFDNINKPLNFTGYVMSRDEIVAKIDSNKVTVTNEDLCPYYLINTEDFLGWLRTRSIDTHRTHSRILRRLLRITATEEEQLVLRVHGATITDTYWIKSMDELNLKYEDIRFKSDYLSEVALLGKYVIAKDYDLPTPELTNIGSYEKCWVLSNGKWCMIKRGTKEEIFSEYFTYKLGSALNFDMAHYKVGTDGIISHDFTEGGHYCFEPMHSLLGDEYLDYDLNYSKIEKFDRYAPQRYLDMLYLDCIVMNFDRHTFNYGILRNSFTGKFEKLAPNFDNNLSLIARGYDTSFEAQKHFMLDIKEFLDDKNYLYPYINKAMLSEVAMDSYRAVDGGIDVDYVINFCMRAYDFMRDKIK